ncbi:hypothetical protein KQX54_002675 [Cotesia glomerata]|uniref:Uncharacterized protein n=1 Tax=Cotesia glomerata TaxID=32391 RepID=A0AAV7IQA6_COTGL|nr:hypothetical protein KQX54_002675 [Cotesia glomerata]
MQENYLPPDHDDFLTPEQIKLRYQDTSLIIFKEQRNRNRNYLSFGTSRRTIEYSNFGSKRENSINKSTEPPSCFGFKNCHFVEKVKSEVTSGCNLEDNFI